MLGLLLTHRFYNIAEKLGGVAGSLIERIWPILVGGLHIILFAANVTGTPTLFGIVQPSQTRL